MKRSFALVASIVLLSALSLAAAPPTAEDEVRAAVANYRQALVKKDLAALKQIWSEDYLFINTRGELHTKADRLADLASGKTSLESIKHEEQPTVHVHGETAIVMSLVTIAGRYSGHEVDGQFRSTHVWIHQNGHWWLVANQLTPVVK